MYCTSAIASCAAARQSPFSPRPIAAILIALFISLAAYSCTCGSKPDFRNVRWGMSKEEVKKHESADLMKEGSEVLIYRIGGGVSTLESEGTVKIDVNGVGNENAVLSPPRVTIDVETPEPEYDVVYAFKDGKLGMAVLHLRDTAQDPAEYIELLRDKSAEISKETGSRASGVAEYGGGEPVDDPYSRPGDICRGEYALRHTWPTFGKRTDITVELDEKKYSPAPDCNLAVFYESVKFPVGSALSDELHETL